MLNKYSGHVNVNVTLCPPQSLGVLVEIFGWSLYILCRQLMAALLSVNIMCMSIRYRLEKYYNNLEVRGGRSNCLFSCSEKLLNSILLRKLDNLVNPWITLSGSFDDWPGIRTQAFASNKPTHYILDHGDFTKCYHSWNKL